MCVCVCVLRNASIAAALGTSAYSTGTRRFFSIRVPITRLRNRANPQTGSALPNIRGTLRRIDIPNTRYGVGEGEGGGYLECHSRDR